MTISALIAGNTHIFSQAEVWLFVYCESLKYSGNNKIAIKALCPYALL